MRAFLSLSKLTADMSRSSFARLRAQFVAALVLLSIGAVVDAAAQSSAGTPGRFLGREEIRLYGLGLVAAPARQTVPRDIATIVQTYLAAPTTPGALPPFAPDAEVRATLRGPSFSQPVELRARPNEAFAIPAMTVAGLHSVDNIRLMSGGDVLLYASPESVEIEVIDRLLVTEVRARPLTADEIRERGIVFDRSNFQAYNFTAAFALADGAQINLNFPVLLPSLAGASDVSVPTTGLEQLQTAPQLPSLATIIPDTLRIQTQVPNLSVVGFTLRVPQLQGQTLVVPPIPGVIVIPGDIGFLNQYFSVLLLVSNVAPDGSNLVVDNLTATIVLPAGNDGVVGSPDDSLRMAQTATGESSRVQFVARPGPDGRLGTSDDILTLGPGETNSAEFLVEGRREGSHVVEMELAGTLNGLPVGPVPIRGRAAGAVLVRNPAFTLTFAHPDVVNAGEPYTLDVTVTNTSAAPANFVSLNLFARNLNGATLVGDATRSIDQILPGDSATVSYDLVSLLTGKVTAGMLAGDENVSGRFQLKAGVGELGVPLSPDSLVLPKEARSLPKSVRDAALGLLGRAHAVATAPPAALSPDVTRFTRKIVYDRAIEVAEAGFRHVLGESLPATATHLLFDFAGSHYTRIAERARNADERAFDERDARGFDELRRRSFRGDALAAALGAVIAPELDDLGSMNFHEAFASRVSFRPGHLSVLLAGPGAAGYDVIVRDATGRVTAVVDDDRPIVKQIPFSDLVPIGEPGSAEPRAWLALVAVPEGDYLVELRRRPGSAGGPIGLSLVVPLVDGTLRQVAFEGLDGTRRPTVQATDDDAIGIDVAIVFPDGTTPDETIAPTLARAIVDPAPFVVAAVQMPEADSVGCADTAPTYPGRIIAVLFSEEIDPAEAEDKRARGQITKYVVDGNEVVGVALQPGRRIAFLALREGVGPYERQALTISDIADRRGARLSSQTVDITIGVDGSGGVVTGRVLDAEGRPVPFATLRLLYEFPCVPNTLVVGITEKSADADGRYAFNYVNMGPTARLVAIDPETGAFRQVRFGVQRAGQRMTVDIVMLGRGTYEGRTLAEDGRPLARTSVRVTSLTDQSQYGATTDAEGRFRVVRVPVGPVLVEAVNTTRNARVFLNDVIPTAGAIVERDIVLLDEARAGAVTIRYGTLRGLVLRADGLTPVGNVPVFAYYRHLSQAGVRCPGASPPPECAVAAARTDASGAYVFDRVVAGDLRIVALDEATLQQGMASTVLVADALVDVNVLLAGGLGTVNGVVLDPAGDPVPGARVGGGLALVVTDDLGRFTLQDVPLGTREIVAVSDLLQSRGSTTVSIVRAGDTVNATIVLDAFGAIAGRVFGTDGTTPQPGIVVYALARCQGAMCVYGQATTNETGGYRIDALPMGSYTISAFRRDFTEGNFAQVSLSFFRQVAAANVVFRGQGRVTGRVVDSNGTTPLRAVVGIAGDQLAVAGGRIAVNFQRVDNYRIVETNASTGAFSFAGVWQGSFTLRAAGQFSPDPIAFEGTIPAAGATTDVTLRLQATSAIGGTVFSPAGLEPVGPGVSVRYRSAAFKLVCSESSSGGSQCQSIPQGIQDEATVTDERGQFYFPLVNAGAFVLTFDDGQGRVAEVRGSVAPGETASIDARLVGLGSAVIRVFEANRASDGSPIPVPGARVSVRQIEGARRAFENLVAPSVGPDAGVIRLTSVLSEGAFVVTATDQRNGFVGRADGRISVEGEEVVVDVYLANAKGVVEGRVLRADGITPVANAEVVVTQGRPVAFLVTNADGEFSEPGIPLGAYAIDVFDAATAARGATTGRIDLQGQVSTSDILLSAVAVVRGRVLDAATGLALRGWTVSLSQTLPSGRSAPALVTMSGLDGSYSFPGATLGAFTVRASRSGVVGSGEGTGQIVRAGQVVDVPVLVSVERAVTATLAGVVRRADGSPAASAAITIGGPSGVRELTAAADGTFMLMDLRLGRYKVEARAQASADTGVAFADLTFADQTTSVVVVLEGLGRVVGQVIDTAGNPVPFARVELTGQPASGCGNGPCLGAADASGQFAFNAVAARTFTVTASTPDGLVRGAVGDVLTAGGERQVIVVLEPSAAVSGTVHFANGQPAPSITAELVGAGRRLFAATDDEGRFVFPVVSIAGARNFTLDLTDPIGPGIARRLITVNASMDLGVIVLDEADPAVASTTPTNGATVVARDVQVRIEFSEPIELTTATAANIRLVSERGEVNGVITPSDGNRVIAFRPLDELDDQVRYAIEVANVRDLIGKRMRGTFTATFTTVDVTPPSKIEITPPPGATGVTMFTPVRIKYSEPIDPARFDGVPIELTTSGQPVDGRIDYLFGNTVVVFSPARPFVENAVYNVVVRPATDFAGQRESAPFSYQFSTTDRTPPVVAGLRSLDGETVIENTVTRVVADVLDTDVAFVDFFVNDQLVAVARALPFTLSVQATPQFAAPGDALRVAAVATDTSGNRGPASAELAIGVVADAPPTVTITAPATGTRVLNGGRVNVSVDARDDVGVIEMAFRARVGQTTIAIGTRPIAPAATTRIETFGFDVPGGLAPGTAIAIEASARDTAGRVVEAAPLAITVEDGVAPTVSIASPASGQIVQPGQDVNVVVFASDAGGIVEVGFAATGVVVASEVRAITPAQASLATSFTVRIPAGALPNERATLTAYAIDTAGNRADAGAATLVVADTVAPTVTLASEDGRFEMVPGRTVRLVASANDDSGITRFTLVGSGAFAVSRTVSVEPPLATATTTFEILVPDTVADGATLRLEARAVDLSGNTSAPAVVTLTAVRTADVTLPSSVVVDAGRSVEVDVTLSAPAPAGGTRITLQSSATTVATVTSFVDIAAGEQSARLEVTGVSGGTAAISALIGGVERASMTASVAGGIVRGRVVDTTLTPVAGVDVTVFAWTEARATTTDAEGRFEVRGLTGPGVTARVIDQESGRLGYGDGVMNRASGFVNLPDIVLVEAGSFVGAVVGADGTTPAREGVRVDLFRSINGTRGELLSTTFTGEAGGFAFRLVSVGEYQIEATDATTGDRGRITTAIAATGAEVDVVVPFLGRGNVRVTVRSADGTAVVPNATVTLSSSSIFGGAPTRTANTGLSGVATFDQVFVGSFSVSGTDPTSQTSGFASGVVTTHGETVDVEVRLAPVGTITGVVLRADGSRVGPNVPVGLVATARSTFTDANGEFVFEFVPLGSYTVRATESATRGQGTATATLTTTVRLADVTVQFLPQGLLRVTVVDANDQPVEGAAVSARVTTTLDATDELTGTTNASGLLVLSNLLAGEVRVTAAKSGLSGVTTTTLPAGGDVTVTVALQPVASIAGQVFLPNGESPATAGTVQVRYRTGSVVRTLTLTESDGGEFLAENLPLTAYDVFAYDAQGRLRAVRRNIVLSENGQVANVSLTFVGVGTVTGLVTNPNGTSAAGLVVTVQALAPEVGRTVTAITNAGGIYTVSGVPVGSVFASTSNPALELMGEASGTLTADGQTLTLNIALQSSAVALPLSQPLRDAYLQDFSMQRDGAIYGGGNYYVFGDGAMFLDVVRDGAVERFAGSAIGQYEDGRREVSVRQDNVRGLNVTRKLFVPATGYFGRYLETLSNPGAEPVTVDVRVTANVRAWWPTSVTVQATSSGDTVFAPGDRWVVVDDGADGDPQYTSTLPPVAFVVDGDDASVSVGQAGLAAGDWGAGIVTYEWRQITVPAFGRVTLMHFVSMQTSRAAAIATGERLAQLPPEAMVGLSAVEVQEIANFAVPADLLGNVEPLPPLTGRATVTMYEGDGSTLVTGSSSVRFKSTVPVFTREFSISGSSNPRVFESDLGVGRPVPAASVEVIATHPDSSVQSAPLVVPLTTTTPQLSVPLVFTGTAIVDVNLRRLDGSIVPSGQITSATTRIEQGTYSRSKSVNTQGTARFFGVPVGVGPHSLSATGNHSQGGAIQVSGFTPTFTAGQLNTTEVVFNGGTITGVVALASGGVASGRAVRIANSTATSPTFQRNTTTDASGAFTTTDLPPGTYYLRVTHPSGAQYHVPQSYVVGPGETVVANQVLPAYGSIRTTLRRQNGGLVSGTAILRNSAGTSLSSLSISTSGTTAGEVTFTQVLAGTYTIEVRPLSSTALSVSYSATVADDGEVVTVAAIAPAFGVVSGTIRKGNGDPSASTCNVRIVVGETVFADSICTNASGVYSRDGVPFDQPNRIDVRHPNVFIWTSPEVRSYAGGTNPADGGTLTIDGVRPGRTTVRVTAQDSGGFPLSVRIDIIDLQRPSFTFIGQTSGTTGLIDVTQVPEGSYTIRARDNITGEVLATVTGTVRSQDDDGVVPQTVVVTGPVTGTVTGRVLDVRGTGVPAAEARVRVLTPQGVVLRSDVPVAADGTFTASSLTVNGGAFVVEARWKRDEQRIVSVPAQFETSGQTLTVNVELPIIRGTLEGVVRLTSGEPLGGTRLTVTGGPPWYDYLIYEHAGTDGTFSFTNRWLPHPTVTVHASDGVTGWSGMREATFVDGVARAEFEVEGRLVTITGRVVVADGTTPLRDAAVSVFADDAATAAIKSTTSNRNDGTFDFGPTIVTGNELVLRANHWRYSPTGTERVTLGPGQTSAQVDIVVPVAVLKGAVYLDESRTTRASGGVSMFVTHLTQNWSQSGEFFGQNGEYFYLDPQPASYRVTVQASSGLTVTVPEVVVPAGEMVVRADVVMPPSNDILLTVTNGGVPVPDARVLVAVTNPAGASVEFWEYSNQSGQFLFPLLPLGPAFVQIADYSQGRYASAWVTLPTRGESSPLAVSLDFQASRGTLTGRVYDVAGNPASASVTVQASNGHGPLGGFSTTVSTTSVGGVPGYFTVTNVPAGGVAVTATNNSLVQTGGVYATVTASTTSSVEVRMQTGRWLSTDLEVGDGFYYGIGSTYAEVRSSAYYDDQVNLSSPLGTALRLRVDDDVPCCTSIMARDPLVENGRGFVVGPMRTGRGLFMTRKIFVAGGTDASGQRFLRYLDVVRNPFETDVEVTVTLATYPSIFSWSTLHEAPDYSWFAGIPTNASTVGLGVVNFDGLGVLPLNATMFEQRFRVVIPAGESVGFVRFVELGPRGTGAADALRARILGLRDLANDALAELSEADRRSIVNFRVP